MQAVYTRHSSQSSPFPLSLFLVSLPRPLLHVAFLVHFALLALGCAFYSNAYWLSQHAAAAAAHRLNKCHIPSPQPNLLPPSA